jgi:hypothetical protein
MRRKTRESDADEPDYEPGAQERTVLETYLQSAAAAAPRMKVLDGEAMTIAPDHPDPAVGQVLLMAALGTGRILKMLWGSSGETYISLH